MAQVLDAQREPTDNDLGMTRTILGRKDLGGQTVLVSSLDLFRPVDANGLPNGVPSPAFGGAGVAIQGVGHIGTLRPMMGTNNESCATIIPEDDVSFAPEIPNASPALSTGDAVTVVTSTTQIQGTISSAPPGPEMMWSPPHIVNAYRVQFVLPVLPDLSGAPVFDELGRMVGMLQAMQHSNVAFIIPVEELTI